jgi:two-component system phosphate regulon response regulator PhoB
MKPRILIVEDEEALATLLRYNLEREGFEVETVVRGDEDDTRLKQMMRGLRQQKNYRAGNRIPSAI